MKRMRNIRRVVKVPETGVWAVLSLHPASDAGSALWQGAVLFDTYNAAIFYASRDAVGCPRHKALSHANLIDARVLRERAQRRMDEALAEATEASRRARQIMCGEVVDGGAY